MHADICIDFKDEVDEGDPVTPQRLAKAIKDFEDALGGKATIAKFDFEVTPPNDSASVIMAYLEAAEGDQPSGNDAEEDDAPQGVGGKHIWDPSPPRDLTEDS